MTSSSRDSATPTSAEPLFGSATQLRWLVGSAMASALIAAMWAGPAAAQTSSFEPRVGQAGKDVVWVPTPEPLVEKMLDMAEVTPDDYLIDLGSGDGRTVIAAAQRGLRARGIEYNPDMVLVAQRAAEEAGVADRATFVEEDLFEADFSEATVITMFLLPSINERLAPKLLELEPGTRIVSNTFRMGMWEPDATGESEPDCTRWCNALLWIVPANVDGAWQLDGQALTFEQEYQRLFGNLAGAEITGGRLNGNEIAFTAGDARYVGTVDGNTMSGQVEGSGRSWTAQRP